MIIAAAATTTTTVVILLISLYVSSYAVCTGHLVSNLILAFIKLSFGLLCASACSGSDLGFNIHLHALKSFDKNSLLACFTCLCSVLFLMYEKLCIITSFVRSGCSKPH